jgi:hypothetical protein
MGGFDSAGDILGTVEPVPDVGNVFFVRFFEGPVAQQDRRWVPLKDTRGLLVGMMLWCWLLLCMRMCTGYCQQACRRVHV